jgi:hypothetical protein
VHLKRETLYRYRFVLVDGDMVAYENLLIHGAARTGEYGIYRIGKLARSLRSGDVPVSTLSHPPVHGPDGATGQASNRSALFNDVESKVIKGWFSPGLEHKQSMGLLKDLLAETLVEERNRLVEPLHDSAFSWVLCQGWRSCGRWHVWFGRLGAADSKKGG